MSSLRLLALAAPLLTLTACSTPNLVGTWTGEMDCSDEGGWVELLADLSLEDIGDGEFSGHFEADGTGTFAGDSYSMRLEADVQLELTDDKGGPQDITVLWSNCESWFDSEYMEEECSFGDDWSWDGENELVWSEDDCTMTITRDEI